MLHINQTEMIAAQQNIRLQQNAVRKREWRANLSESAKARERDNDARRKRIERAAMSEAKKAEIRFKDREQKQVVRETRKRMQSKMDTNNLLN